LGLDGALLTWDLVGDRRFIQRRAFTEPAEPASGASVSPTGDALAYVGGVDELQFVDLETGRAGPLVDSGHGFWGWTRWRPDGRRFATAGDDGFVRIWDWHTGQLVTERRVAPMHITGLDYTGDGRRLVVAEQTGTTYAIDAETLQPNGEPVELDRQMQNVYASPDNRTAVVLTTDHFSVVDLDIGRVNHEGEAFGAFGGEFSPDGHRFALGGLGDVRILDVETGEWVGPARRAHTGTVSAVNYAPDGATFVTGADDAAIVLWDARTGAPLNKLLPGRPNEGSMNPSFSADGRTVMITSSAGTAYYTMDTRPEHWIELACAIAGRNLTQEEWNDAFDNRPYRETCPSGSE
jgi:WD40 repeat protein